MEVFEVTEHTSTGSRSVQDSSSDSRSTQYSSSDNEFSGGDSSVEIIAESSLVTSPIFSKTRRGHGARVHQPPRKKKAYEQKYNAKWEKEEAFRGWLTPVKGDPKRAYCSACKRELKAKRSVLTLHADSDGHHKTVCRLIDPHIITMEQLRGFGSNSIPRQVKEAELKLAGFLAEHNLPFQLMDHLSELLSSVCPDSKIAANIKCKRSKMTCIIKNVLGPYFHNGVSTFLQKNPYSLLVDESTDVASMKQLCVVVRYFDDALNRVSARFFSLIDVPIADAATLYDSFRQALEADEVPLSSIVGYASDGANVMMGCNNSFRTRLEAVNPNIFVMKCICHSAHLVASNACTKLPRQAEDFVRDIYSYFNHSARRSVDLSEFQHFTGTEPHKLLHPCQTRWLSLQQCVKRILEQWQALTVYFAHSARADKLIKAERLHGFLSNPHFKIFFIFLNFILPKFTEFNLLFQSSAPNLHLLNKKVQLLYKELLGYYMQPTYLRDTNLTEIDPEARRFMLPINSIYLGVYVAAELARPEILGKIDLVEEFLTRSRDFLSTAAIQIKQRFPLNDPIIRQLEVLHPSCSHEEFPSLVPLALRFPNLIQQSDLQQLDNEWRRLTMVKIPFNHEGIPVDEFWGRLNTVTDGTEEAQFTTLCKFMKCLLVLPHSNADTERVFSQVNLIKTELRNRMKTKTVSALLSAKEGIKITFGDCCKFSPSDELVKLMHSAVLYDDDNT